MWRICKGHKSRDRSDSQRTTQQRFYECSTFGVELVVELFELGSHHTQDQLQLTSLRRGIQSRVKQHLQLSQCH